MAALRAVLKLAWLRRHLLYYSCCCIGYSQSVRRLTARASKKLLFLMASLNFKSVVWKEGAQYVSQCLDVDVSSFGDTRKQALENLQEALELYFEGRRLPAKSRIQNPAIASVKLQYA